MSDGDITAKLIIMGGYSLTRDIVNQISTLTDTLKKGESTELDSTHYRSVLTAITLLSFNTIEAYVNFLAVLVEKSNEGLSDAPNAENKLDDTEIDALLERKTHLDPKKMKVEKNEKKFLRILDKLDIIPKSLAELFNIEFKIDKSGKEWRYIRKLKIERDKITHLKFDSNLLPKIGGFERPDDIQKINPTYNIIEKDVFNGIEGIRWYILKCGKLIQQIYKEKVSCTSLKGTDTIFYKMLSDYNKVYKIYSDKLFQKNVPGIEIFKTDYEDEFSETLFNLTRYPEDSPVEFKDLSRNRIFSDSNE